MTATVHQRVSLFIIDHNSVADEWLAELYTAGARVLKVHLQDHGMLPRDKMDRWKALGYKLWGVMRPSGQPLNDGGIWHASDAAVWLSAEKRRLGLQGADCNFEAEVQQVDLAGIGWSREFTNLIRSVCPTLPMQLDTYPIEGLDHLAYRDEGFRVTVQTYSPDVLFNWTPAWIMDWCQRVGWPKAKIKVTLPVHTINGVRSPVAETLQQMAGSGVIGCTLYPVESAMPPTSYLTELVGGLIAEGVAR